MAIPDGLGQWTLELGHLPNRWRPRYHTPNGIVMAMHELVM